MITTLCIALVVGLIFFQLGDDVKGQRDRLVSTTRCVCTMHHTYVARFAIRDLIIHTQFQVSLFTAIHQIPYNGNCPRKKKFTNFANLEAFANVFLHFLSWPEFLYMRLPKL